MAYESIDRLKKYMQKKIDAIVTGEKVTFNINAHQLLDEINEMERKARAWDNYMVDTYIYDKVYSDGDHKEAYDFYMKPDVKSYIDCLNKELADTGHFINSVEEYKQILNEIEDK